MPIKLNAWKTIQSLYDLIIMTLISYRQGWGSGSGRIRWFLARRIRIRYFFQRIRIRILPVTMDLSTNSSIKWWVIISNFIPTYLQYKYIFFCSSISGRIRSRIRLRSRIRIRNFFSAEPDPDPWKKIPDPHPWLNDRISLTLTNLKEKLD